MGIAILILRRASAACGYAELGGPSGTRRLTSLILVMLWMVYIVLSALQAYDHISIEF